MPVADKPWGQSSISPPSPSNKHPDHQPKHRAAGNDVYHVQFEPKERKRCAESDERREAVETAARPLGEEHVVGEKQGEVEDDANDGSDDGS